MFVELSNRRLHSLLENIILALDTKSILACRDVSRNWCQIVDSCLESKNRKFQKRQDLRIAQEWRKKRPLMYKISLEKYNICHVNCFHIIGDENEVIVAANVNRTNKAKIIIIDSKTATVKSVLDITNSKGVELEVLDMKMALDDNYLVSYIHGEMYQEMFYRVWRRTDNYSSNCLERKCEPSKTWNKRDSLNNSHLQNVPIFAGGWLLVSKYNIRCNLVWKAWNVSDNTERIFTDIIYSSDSPYFVNEFGFGSYDTFSIGMAFLNPLISPRPSALYWKGKEGLCKIPFPFNYRPRLAGYTEQYIAIQYVDFGDSYIKIHRVNDGRPVLHIPSQPIDDLKREDPYQIQISKERVAFKGLLRDFTYMLTGVLEHQIYDLIISDLETGKIILSCTEDLGVTLINNFLIQPKNLIFDDLGGLYFAKFWV